MEPAMKLSVRIEPREAYRYVLFTGDFDLREGRDSHP